MPGDSLYARGMGRVRVLSLQVGLVTGIPVKVLCSGLSFCVRGKSHPHSTSSLETDSLLAEPGKLPWGNRSAVSEAPVHGSDPADCSLQPCAGLTITRNGKPHTHRLPIRERVLEPPSLDGKREGGSCLNLYALYGWGRGRARVVALCPRETGCIQSRPPGGAVLPRRPSLVLRSCWGPAPLPETGRLRFRRAQCSSLSPAPSSS